MSEEEKTSKVDQREPWQKNPEFNVKLVILISLGFFSTSVWSFFNTQVSYALQVLFGNLFLVGFIMTIDNIIGVIIQPWTGSLSDKTKSKFGRRMPFVMIGLPISAVSFFCLGLTKDNPLLYILSIIIFDASMAIWRAPIVALMPDFVHPDHRTKGNAIVNVLGGIGTFALSLIGSQIVDINYALAFSILAIVMVIAGLILFFSVKEPDTREWDFAEMKNKEEKLPGFIDNLKFIRKEEDKSMLWMLLAIFCWFIAYNTGGSLFSVYAKEYFNATTGQAGLVTTFVSIAFLGFAAFSVLLAKKFGRKKTLIFGLVIWAISYLVGSIFEGEGNLNILYVSFLVMGAGWACVNINSIAMVWAMAPDTKSTGVYTGLYYAASFSSQVIGPLSFGFIFEFIPGTLRFMLPILAVLLILAIFFMLKVKRGDD